MKRTYALILFVILTLSATPALAFWTNSPSLKVHHSKLSAEELGTLEAIEKSIEGIDDILRIVNRYISLAERAKARQNYGLANSYYAKANKYLYQFRDGVARAPLPKTYLVYPDSMAGISAAITKLVIDTKTLPASGPLDVRGLNIILDGLRAVNRADHNFANSARLRRVNPDLVKPKVSLNIELKPFPFKLEVLNGEFKLKKSFSFGGFSGDLGVGNYGSRRGVTTLVLIHNNYRRVYAIGGRALSFSLPAGADVHINGSVMTIVTR